MATVRLEQQQTSGGVGNVDFDLAYNRPKYDGEEMTGQTDIPRVPQELADLKDGYRVETLENNLADVTKELQEDLAKEALARQEGDDALSSNFDLIRETQVQFDTEVSADASTTTITKTTGHLLRGDATKTAMPLPVASATTAGVMNAATYNAIQGNSEKLDALIEGAIAIDTLPAEPTQEELTEAYKNATHQDDVMNRASIYDGVNGKIYYFYTNVNEWKAGDISDKITISQATNDTTGIVKGSENEGQIAVEPDGSMSLNGYDGIKHDLDNLSELIDGKTMPYTPHFIVGDETENSIVISAANELSYYELNSITNAHKAKSLKFANATDSIDGFMSKEDKAKMDSLVQITALGAGLAIDENGVMSVIGGGGGETGLTQEAITRANNLPTQVFYNTGPTDYNSNELEVHLILKDLHTGGDATMPFTINGAIPADGDTAGKAGVMTADQATKLARIPEKVDSEFSRSPIAESDHVAISYTETDTTTGEVTYPMIRLSEATPTQAGVMTAADKAKLDSIGAGTIVDNIPMTVSTLNPINMVTEVDLTEYDALLIRYTMSATYRSDVLNKDVKFQYSGEVLTTVTNRYGDNNQFAEWDDTTSYSCECLYFTKPRRVHPFISVMDAHTIQFRLDISSASLMMEYVDWMVGEYDSPTNVTVIGFKFPK